MKAALGKKLLHHAAQLNVVVDQQQGELSFRKLHLGVPLFEDKSRTDGA
jgi:hypothetical protein